MIVLAVYLSAWVGLGAILSETAGSGQNRVVPDAGLQAELAPEVRLTEYAFRPPQGMVLTKYEPRADPSAPQFWHWKAPGSQLVVRVEANDRVAANSAGIPEVQTQPKPGPLVITEQRDLLYVVHGGQVSQHTVDGVLFTNVRWDRRISLSIVPISAGDQHTNARSAWVTYDGPVRIDICAATTGTQNSPQIAMMEQSVHSLRRLKDGESLDAPRLQQWAPDPSTIPVATPGTEPVVAAVERNNPRDTPRDAGANDAREVAATDSVSTRTTGRSTQIPSETEPLPIWTRQPPRERSVPVKILLDGPRGFRTAGVDGTENSTRPRRSTTSETQDDPAEPPAPTLAWPQFERVDVSLHVPDIRNQAPRFYGPGIPFMVIGRTIYELQNGQKHATLPLDVQPQSALSPDGRWFAQISPGTPDPKLCEVDLVEVETGELVRRLIIDGREGNRDSQMLSLRFVGPALLEAASLEDAVIWDVTTGTPFRHFSHSRDSYAISPDFQHVAIAEFSQFGVHSMATGEQVASLARPTGEGAVFSSFDYLAFSPDGQQIAGMKNLGQQLQVCCWNNRGQVVLDTEVPQRFSVRARSIQWLPDGESLILNGRTIIDVKRGIPVWTLAEGTANLVTDKWAVVTGDTVSLAGQRSGVINAAEIPWDRIRRGLESVDDGTAVTIDANTPVALETAVAADIPQLESLSSSIAGNLPGILQRLGWKIAGEGEQPALTLRFTYSESPIESPPATEGTWSVGTITITCQRGDTTTPMVELFGKPFRSDDAGSFVHRKLSAQSISNQLRDSDLPRTIGTEALPVIHSVFPGLRQPGGE